MLNMLLKVAAPFSRGDKPKAGNPAATPQEFCSTLRIVHPGGAVEHYNMAIPAVKILEKYPSYVLAKPEVFSRPWDSVVRPDKILTPGHKLLLVPIGTVKKLRQRIEKPTKDQSVSFRISDEARGSFISGYRKTSGLKKRVTFVGIDVKHKHKHKASPDIKTGNTNDGKHQSTSISQSHGGHRRPRYALVPWHPSLASVNEIHGN